ncbi:MAG: glycosyltransferase family 4 protein [Chitinophagaceae bacterium]|nr:glycosyltransferase family 4 protein [Anaerolineae bacterium]
MRIAIDASRTTAAHITGTENYAIELIRAIIRHNTADEITLYFRDTPPSDLFPFSERVIVKTIPFRRIWTHVRFAAALWRDRPDVVFVPAHTLPFFFPGKAIVTVHDLGYKIFPQAHPPRSRWYLDLTTRYSAHRAAVVLADSQATAEDLMRFYGTASDKIRVVYPGVHAPVIGDIPAMRRKYGLPERYFLFIGTLQPRKNIERIVAAYARWREKNPSEDMKLVLAGAKGWLYDEAWTADVPGVIFPGYIDDADKGALIAGAQALVFPTLYEGFGFPVVEAMHCGTPVIASVTSSLPELVGEAGLLVDPLDVEAIASAMDKLVAQDDLHMTLRAKGRVQAAKFTWDGAGESVLEILHGA